MVNKTKEENLPLRSFQKKIFSGVVVSDVMDKTIVVRVTTRKRHPIYGKVFKVSKKFLCHDSQNQAKIGDKVQIQSSRPTSRRKRWVLKEIVDSVSKKEGV